MSYYLIDFEKNFNYNFNNIIIDGKIVLDTNNYKHFIYYDDNNEAKEIFIKIPKIRVIYDFENIKYNNIKIKINPLFNKTNNFIEFIKKLEEDIRNHELFIKKKKKYEFSSIITNEENNYYLKTFINRENVKITSDKNKNLEFNEIRTGGEIQIILKLSHIWLKNKKIGLSSQIYQIKYFHTPIQKDFDFFEEEKVVKVIQNQEEKNNIFNEENKPIKTPFIIDPKILQSVKLKPIN